MMRMTDVVKNLIILNVLLYVATTFIFPHLRDILIFHYPTMDGFMPLQIITHMFMHGQDYGGSPMSMHLIFNMIGLYFFGPPLEALWGPKKFLFYYLFAGFGALALHLIMTYIGFLYPSRMLGASGAVFGLLAGFAYQYPNQQITLLFPPIPMKAKYFVLIFGALELFLGLGGANDGIAHFAHLGGAIFGFLLLLYWEKFGSRL
ncbi:MAG: rhomboid family intramembrane serine protease [Bacteroidota bacterium]